MKLLRAEPHEQPALAWAFAYFFLLLAAYYVLRPVRDALAVQAGADRLQWLFTATFLAMLALVPAYGWLCAKLPRAKFLPAVYGFFILNLVGFYFFPEPGVFFVWLSVFNLFAVSVFWSFMSDIFSTTQARRLYGTIAAGGTAGAMLGPTLTVVLVERLGVANMLLVSVACICVCLLAIIRLVPWARAQEAKLGWKRGEDAIGGSIIGGATLILRSRFLQAACLLMFFGVAVGTLLYNQQQAYAALTFPDRAQRAEFFGHIDQIINIVVLVTQLTITRVVMRRYGPAPLVLIPSVLVAIGFVLLTANPLPLILSAVQIATRAGEFALAKPARESFYTRVDRELRYKSKNFIDTVVYRGGDLTFAWVHDGLVRLGLATAGIAGFGVAMAVAMGASAAWMVWLARGLPVDAHEHDGENAG